MLAALARSGKPMTVGEIAALAVRGSEVGVRRSLARLVSQGIVRATEMGRNRVHELNRDHVAAPIAAAMADLRLTLWQRFRATLGKWNPRPVYGSVFGSAAKGDGSADSDIDLLLVRSPLAGEEDAGHRSSAFSETVAGFAAEFVAMQLTERQAARWDRQVGHLYDQVQRWSGNSLQVVEMSVFDWAEHRRQRTKLFQDVSRDGVLVTGGSRTRTPPSSRSS